MSNLGLPGPHRWPVVGNLPDLARDTLSFMQENAAHGDRVYWSTMRDPLIQLHHPDDIEEILLKHRGSLHKDPVTSGLSYVLGDGLVTSEGDKWKAHRKMIAPSFRPKQLTSYGASMVRSALEDLPEDGMVDFQDWMTRISLHIVLRTLFGAEPGGNADEVGHLIDLIMIGFDVEHHGPARLLPEWVPLPHRVRMARSVDRLNALMNELIAARRAGEPGDDMLWKLIEARDDDGRSFTDEELRDEALTLFIAGHETTSLALSYTFWQLARHPAIQAQVVEELETTLTGREAEARDVRSLPLTSAAIDEAMRLYCPIWTIGRLTVEDITLRDGFTIPKGYGILLPQIVVHRDPRWWSEPMAYRPERWLNGETEDLPRMAYFPFGGGPRVCIGNHFAKMEATLVLASLIRRYQVTVDDEWHPELMPAVTMRSRNGFPLRVARRASARAAAK